MCQFGLVPTATKTTRITKDTISVTDHIIRNSVINIKFKTAILTEDIAGHLPRIYTCKLKTKLDICKTQFLYKRFTNEILRKAFKLDCTKFGGK